MDGDYGHDYQRWEGETTRRSSIRGDHQLGINQNEVWGIPSNLIATCLIASKGKATGARLKGKIR